MAAIEELFGYVEGSSNASVIGNLNGSDCDGRAAS